MQITKRVPFLSLPLHLLLLVIYGEIVINRARYIIHISKGSRVENWKANYPRERERKGQNVVAMEIANQARAKMRRETQTRTDGPTLSFFFHLMTIEGSKRKKGERRIL